MTDAKADEKRFNETLKRMLQTPPKPHDDGDKAAKGQTEKKKAKPAIASPSSSSKQ